MKRIGNFLFVEQWYKDATPGQAIIAINTIACVCPQCLHGNEHTVIALSNNSKIALTGKHDDNMIDLSKLLEKPTTVNQTFDTDIDVEFDDEEDNL